MDYQVGILLPAKDTYSMRSIWASDDMEAMRASKAAGSRGCGNRSAVGLLLCVVLASTSDAAEPIRPATIPMRFHSEGGTWLATGGTFGAAISPSGMTLYRGTSVLRVVSEGASPDAAIEPCASATGRVSVFAGDNPQAWTAGSPAFGCLEIRKLYSGVSQRLMSQDGDLKTEFVLSPGIDPSIIRIRYPAAEAVEIAEDGALLITSGGEKWRESPPVSYQHGKQGSRPVSSRYLLLENNTVSFIVDGRDPSVPLVIDPLVTFGSLIGGSGLSSATAVAADGAGFLYVAGYSDALDLPLRASATPRSGGVEAYVAKLNASTGEFVYATYFGGTADDRALALAVAPDGTVYVAGSTTSTNIPRVTAAQPNLAGSSDAFVFKLSADGTRLLFSTYYGGSQADQINALTFSGGSLWMAGDSYSSTLPGAGAWKSSNSGGQDGFVSKMSTGGQFQSYTFLGGTGNDSAKAIALDASGAVVTGGSTYSPDLPMPIGAAQSALRGGQDAYLIRLDGSLGQQLGGTYLGGSLGGWAGLESVAGIAVDSLQNIYAVGSTPSTDFPTPGAWSGTSAGLQDAFAVKLTAGLNTFLWGTYLGGAGKDQATSVVLDGSNRLLVAGLTTSSNFPRISALQGLSSGGAEGFLVRLTSAQGALDLSTTFGGSGADGVYALALAPGGSVFVAGQSGSIDVPLKNPAQQVSGTTLRMMVARIALGELPAFAGASLGPAGQNGQVLSATLTSSSGVSGISSAELRIGDSLTAQTACRVRFSTITGQFSLSDDAGASWIAVRPGTSDASQNSSCSLLGAGSSYSSSGSTLTINAALQFRAVLTGTRRLFFNAVGSSGEETGFQSVGTVAVQSASNQPPSIGGLSPVGGAGASGTFTFTFHDNNGASDIWYVQMLFNTQVSLAAGCPILLDRVGNVVHLANDAGTGFLPRGIPGISGVLENSQCRIDLSSIRSVASGTTFTVTLNIVFKPLFTGTKTVYAAVADLAGTGTYWTPVGAWTVTGAQANTPPSTGSLSPNTGSGSTASFTASFRDVDGGSDIQVARLLINTSDSSVGACSIHLDRILGHLILLNDAGTGAVPLARLGTKDVAENSQCRIYMEGTSAFVTEGTLTVRFQMAFKAGFAGAKRVYTAVSDLSGTGTWWVQGGTWTVTPAVPNAPPATTALTPPTSSGSAALFTATFTDINGGADIRVARLLINTSDSSIAACSIHLDRFSGQVLLLDDTGAGAVLGRLGTQDIAENSACQVLMEGTSTSESGNTLTAQFNVVFKASFAGSKRVYTAVSDVAATGTWWVQGGTWNVSASALNQAPRIVSVSPSPASGNRTYLSVSMTDANGPLDIASARILINASPQVGGGCYLILNRATNVIYLSDAQGAQFAPVVIGSQASARNGNCTLYGASSALTVSGSLLTLRLDLAFDASFAGSRQIWTNVSDSAGLTSAGQVGTLTITP